MKSILYIQYTEPSDYPPLEHSSLLLVNRGWTVRHLGITAGAANAIVLPRHTSISLDPAHPPDWRGIGHYACFLAKCRSAVRRLRLDVVYCSDMRSYPGGMWASALFGIITVLHEHDPPGRCGRFLHRILASTFGLLNKLLFTDLIRGQRKTRSSRLSPKKVHETAVRVPK